jgi:hypothetical protein
MKLRRAPTSNSRCPSDHLRRRWHLLAIPIAMDILCSKYRAYLQPPPSRERHTTRPPCPKGTLRAPYTNCSFTVLQHAQFVTPWTVRPSPLSPLTPQVGSAYVLQGAPVVADIDEAMLRQGFDPNVFAPADEMDDAPADGAAAPSLGHSIKTFAGTPFVPPSMAPSPFHGPPPPPFPTLSPLAFAAAAAPFGAVPSGAAAAGFGRAEPSPLSFNPTPPPMEPAAAPLAAAFSSSPPPPGFSGAKDSPALGDSLRDRVPPLPSEAFGSRMEKKKSGGLFDRFRDSMSSISESLGRVKEKSATPRPPRPMPSFGRQVLSTFF